MFPRTIKNVNIWYFNTKTSTPIDCLFTYFYRSLVRKTVCFGLYIDKTCDPDVFSESSLNTDTRIMGTLWHVPLCPYYPGSTVPLRPRLRTFSEPSDLFKCSRGTKRLFSVTRLSTIIFFLEISMGSSRNWVKSSR